MKTSFLKITFIFSCFVLCSCWGKASKNTQNKGIDSLTQISVTENTLYATYLEQATSYQSIKLPFSLDQYLDYYYKNTAEDVDKMYPSYTPTLGFKKYLKSINYDAEEYKCFIIPSTNPNMMIFLTWVLRGDSEYYLLITANTTNINDYLQCGLMGDDSPISFVLSDNLEIKVIKKMAKEDETTIYSINDEGKFNKITGQ